MKIYIAEDGSKLYQCETCHRTSAIQSPIENCQHGRDQISHAPKNNKAHIVRFMEFEGQCYSSETDRWYDSPEEAQENGETGVHPAELTLFRLEHEDVEDLILDDTHEGATIDDTNGYNELADAIDRYNEAQVTGTWHAEMGQMMKLKQPHTLAMIKPCAMADGKAADIIADIKAAGYHITEKYTTTLTTSQAERLYEEHQRKEHYRDLVNFTTSGPVMVMIIKGEHDNTAAAFRELVIETLRPKYATGIRTNAIHASDSPIAYLNERAILQPQNDS